MSAAPVWMCLDEYTGLWRFTQLQHVTLAQELDALAPALQEELEVFPHLAGDYTVSGSTMGRWHSLEFAARAL
jgi:hypothetical protein